MRRTWTDREIHIITEWYPHINTRFLAKWFNVSEEQLYRKANQLGIKKSKNYLINEWQKNADKLKNNGVAYRFPKGNIPANKGQKMTPEQYEACKATMFKKGDLPKNTLHDGCITIRHTSAKKGRIPYKHIRISQGKWRMLHVVEWEKYNGAIPDGHIIIFKDGDTMNCSIENLMMISKEENAYRNRFKIHLLPDDIQTLIRTKIKLSKKIKELKNGTKK